MGYAPARSSDEGRTHLSHLSQPQHSTTLSQPSPSHQQPTPSTTSARNMSEMLSSACFDAVFGMWPCGAASADATAQAKSVANRIIMGCVPRRRPSMLRRRQRRRCMKHAATVNRT
mgnify:CR=1 FL=1